MAPMMSASQRRAQRMIEAASKEVQMMEEAVWEESDKKAQAKAARVQAREERADTKLQKKTERRAVEERETEELDKLQEAKASKKVTQAEVSRRQALACMAGQRPRTSKAPVSLRRTNSNLSNSSSCSSVIEASGLDDILMAFETANQF